MIYQNEERIHLSKIISPSFYDVHKEIMSERYTHYFINGGRGSCKSSFISIEIILGMMKNKNANCVILRKVAKTLKESVFEQMKWAINILGLEHLWEEKSSPLSLVLKETQQKIIFRGADNPQKIKSIKVNKGYIRYIWYEELDEFSNIDEVRNINQSIMRGGHKFDVFYSYNPPKNVSHWTNNDIFFNRDDSMVFKSTYVDVPKEFLGSSFFIEAEHLKNTNFSAYENEYLGIVTGLGTEVFKNISLRKISDDEKQLFKTIVRGIDWGYAADPFVYLVLGYDNKHKRCYIFYEYYKVGAKFKEIIQIIKNENKLNEKIIADSAEPRSNDELKTNGINIVASKKGAGSVDFGINYLANLEEIVIDPYSCPNTAREFSSYCTCKDKFGNGKGGYLDRDNHTIDAVRYALNQYIKINCISFN